jgi:hypothetical protein
LRIILPEKLGKTTFRNDAWAIRKGGACIFG